MIRQGPLEQRRQHTPEAAFDGLSFHTVVGCFHGKTCYVTFQWFVCAFTGCAAVTMIHDGYLLLKYMVCVGLNIIKWIKIIHFKGEKKGRERLGASGGATGRICGSR